MTTPAGLDKRGRAFWKAVADKYDLSLCESEMLLETCRTLDVVERLRDTNEPRLLAELRQQRLALGRMLAQLAIPADTLESAATVRARKAALSRWSGHEKRSDL